LQAKATGALEHRLRPGKFEIIYNLAQLRSAAGSPRPSSFDDCSLPQDEAMNWPDLVPWFEWGFQFGFGKNLIEFANIKYF